MSPTKKISITPSYKLDFETYFKMFYEPNETETALVVWKRLVMYGDYDDKDEIDDMDELENNIALRHEEAMYYYADDVEDIDKAEGDWVKKTKMRLGMTDEEWKEEIKKIYTHLFCHAGEAEEKTCYCDVTGHEEEKLSGNDDDGWICHACEAECEAEKEDE